MNIAHDALILGSALLAGFVNSIAGGGTLFTFPTLLWLGRDPIIANATSTVALLPGSLTAALGFRQEIGEGRRWIMALAAPSLIGGIVGALLLLRTPSAAFELVVPFLILGATLLLAAQEVITRSVGTIASDPGNPSQKALAGAIGFQLVVGIYGGYFGAGIGILMLAALALIGLVDIHQMNGMKNLLAVLINGVAATLFIISGSVLWRDAAIMAVGAISGGLIGPRIAKRLGRAFVRKAVVAVGLLMSIALMVKQYG